MREGPSRSLPMLLPEPPLSHLLDAVALTHVCTCLKCMPYDPVGRNTYPRIDQSQSNPSVLISAIALVALANASVYPSL